MKIKIAQSPTIQQQSQSTPLVYHLYLPVFFLYVCISKE